MNCEDFNRCPGLCNPVMGEGQRDHDSKKSALHRYVVVVRNYSHNFDSFCIPTAFILQIFAHLGHVQLH